MLAISLFSLFLLPSVSAVTWVDPETPVEALSTTAMDGRSLSLVFSDEFEADDRPFEDGADTRWTAEDRPGTTNAALHYYNSSKVKTSLGNLVIQTTAEKASWIEIDPNDEVTEYPFSRNYVSGMVTTWNKFCFTSGMVEISFQLPGTSSQPGLWPAFWMLGNLARPSYLGSTDKIWPWSYDQCGNSSEAQDALLVQELNACGEGPGRGSPEIDIIEAQPGNFVLEYPNVAFTNGTTASVSVGRPLVSSSLQIAPGVDDQLRVIVPNFPVGGDWYPDLYPMGSEAYGPYEPKMLNNYWYGQLINTAPNVWQDGLSCNWQHSDTFYNQQTVIRMEWQAGKDDGYVRFLYGDQLIYEITADMLKSRPGASDTIPQIPYEAMYMILNTDISPRWGWNGCNPMDPCMLANPEMCSDFGVLLCQDCSNPDCLKCPNTTQWLAELCGDISPQAPAEYKIDYIRVYQDPNDPSHTVGCDPPGYPTRDYIEANKERYTFNPVVRKEPLVKVQHGGGSCERLEDCGGSGNVSRGLCVEGRCDCLEEWTGPNCNSPCIGEFADCEGSRSPAASLSPSPSASPIAGPSESPSADPSVSPIAGPSVSPSADQSVSPTAGPSPSPSAGPSMPPTAGSSPPSMAQSSTAAPSQSPTAGPSPLSSDNEGGDPESSGSSYVSIAFIISWPLALSWCLA